MANDETNRILIPANFDAEQAVLNLLLDHPEDIPGVAAMLPAEAFYRAHYQHIYRAMLHLKTVDLPVDMITLVDRLTTTGVMSESEAYTELATVKSITPMGLIPEQYAQIVRTKWQQRRLIELSNKLCDVGYRHDGGESELIDRAGQMFAELAKGSVDRATRSFQDVLKSVVGEVDERARGDGTPPGLRTGLIDVDDALGGGFQPGDFILLAARPSMGKTAFALWLTYQAAKAGKRTAYFSLEMTAEQLVYRILAAELSTDVYSLRSGRVTEAQLRRMYDLIDENSNLVMKIDDNTASNPASFTAKVERLHAEYGLDLVVVDYLQLMDGGKRYEGNRVQEVSEISRSLKNLAHRLRIPVLALSQLSRACESRQDRRPIYSDLRESGGLEQDADTILFLYRDEVYNPTDENKNIAELAIAKQRMGPIRIHEDGSIKLLFVPESTKFLSLAQDEV